MPVLTVKDGMHIESNFVYVIPPGKTMTLQDNCLNLIPKGASLKPIDAFFSSLAQQRKTQAIGIVLSGTGTDGTEGLKEIKSEGGITFAQDPKSAQYSGMPQSAISSEAADFILSPEQMGREISKIASNPQLVRAEIEAVEAKGETRLSPFFNLLKSNFKVDFSQYKEAFLNRRIKRRMVLNHLDNLKDYVEFLQKNPNELQKLFDDLLVGVTSFFREPDTFALLKEKVFPEIAKNKLVEQSIRVWVVGCSSGEEAYSFAIALLEFLEEKKLTSIPIQLFGTDINQKNIDKARQGVYPKNIDSNVSEERLKKYFSVFNGSYRISKGIRDLCVFSKQDITADPPFSNVDLVSCRNMLIYFDSNLQEKIVPILHYAIKPNGFLVLGESESVGKLTTLFEPQTTRGIIYTKKKAQPRVTFGLETFAAYPAKKLALTERKDSVSLINEEVDKLLLTDYVPASLLVNSNLDTIVIRGNLAPYMKLESGLASLNLAKVLRKEVRADVQNLVYRAKKEDKIIREDAIRFEHQGHPLTVNIQVIPVKLLQYEESFFLVLFEDVSSAATHLRQAIELTSTPEGRENAKGQQILDLREELDSTKHSMQTIIESQESTNEELKASMEEVQSTSEELQSTNEELETAKEELQSSNEELTTLNDELKNRNQTIALLNADLTNVSENVDSPVVLVDRNLKIRLFNPAAEKILNLMPGQIGLPITSVSMAINVENIEKTLLDIIATNGKFTRDVRDKTGRVFELRVRPYLIEKNRVEGAVLAFSDITERKKQNDETIAKLASFPTQNPNPVVEVDFEGNVSYSNPATKNIFPDLQKLGSAHPLLCDWQNVVKVLQEKSRRNLLRETKVGEKWYNQQIYLVPDTKLIRIYMSDISERKKAEAQIVEQLQMLDLAHILVRNMNDEIIFWNSGAQIMYCFSKEEALGKIPRELLKTVFPKPVEQIKKELLRNGKWEGELIHKKADGSIIYVASYWVLHKDNNGKPVAIIEVNNDITELKKAEEKLEDYRRNLEKLVEERTKQLKDAERLAAIGATAGMVGHDIRNPLQAMTSDVYLAKTDLASTSESEEKKNALESLDEIEKNISYINKIVQDLQDFARPLKPVAKETDTQNLIADLLSKNGVPKDVEVEVKVKKQANTIMADSDILKRILGNLLTNAIQAMPQGGKLSIQAYKKENNSIIEVIDTGVGIPKDVKEKLFTPLFTTKSKGQGFGLAVVKRMTESLGGTVTFESEEGKGTKFILCLPPPKELNGKLVFK